MERLFTIGAYGFDSGHFFEVLDEAKVDLFLDIRRRRGVRGRDYAFANAGRLQEELEARGIDYRHVIELAPDQETRTLQDQEDAAQRVARRKRAVLGEAFISAYRQRTLEPFDWDALVKELEGFRRPVLFCVERMPEACHRHLVAARLVEVTGVPVTDLVLEGAQGG
jgi:uncharacterized protein (DUF488 family)